MSVPRKQKGELMQVYICRDCIARYYPGSESKEPFMFVTSFYDPVESPFCPNCGSDEHTEYVNDVDWEVVVWL